MDFEPGGFLSPTVTHYQNPHPWKSEVWLPLRPSPGQLLYAAAIVAFQDEIELIDSSFLDD